MALNAHTQSEKEKEWEREREGEKDFCVVFPSSKHIYGCKEQTYS